MNREQTLDGTLVGLQVQPYSFGIIIWSWFLLQSLCLFSLCFPLLFFVWYISISART